LNTSNTNLKEPFTAEDLRKAWEKYLIKIHGQLNKTLILKGQYSLEGKVIHLGVNNLIQQQTLNLFKEELMMFLRAELKNFDITLDSFIIREGGGGKQMYTPQER